MSMLLNARRCRVTSSSPYDHAQPLRDGNDYCAHHAHLVCQLCDDDDDDDDSAQPTANMTANTSDGHPDGYDEIYDASDMYDP